MENTGFGVELENLDYRKLHWQSDWNGYEVGYDERGVIGFYSYGKINMFINMETYEVLEIWLEEEQ